MVKITDTIISPKATGPAKREIKVVARIMFTMPIQKEDFEGNKLFSSLPANFGDWTDEDVARYLALCASDFMYTNSPNRRDIFQMLYSEWSGSDTADHDLEVSFLPVKKTTTRKKAQ